ncbi:serine hydrolase domain-containing protein [Nocardioides sp. Kera G14]|uniref:serine hydrolase domain-containing protein n=1 Tax=Nocardioides sp. Kera G14 TaxID=2884264 RepID=UPI001D0FA395|nr:serine hydrolase domain-containing protein [Nocardioides sp. Kera G14]UDY24905.1 beta-lactamase family protein [Nocardioides sp. Kera G14]
MTAAPRVEGFAHPSFEPLRELLQSRLDAGDDAGASLAVIRDGETLADLWGGTARPGMPWQEDTITQVWSITKTMAALTVLVLADRGVIDLEAPASTYWKALADGPSGDRVLVRHLLAHTSGLPGWTDPLDVEGLLDLERSEAMLAAQEPWWEPGTASGYCMISYGHLLDAVVRGATGRPLSEVFREEIAVPLGADFHLGVPADALERCADLIAPTERLDLPPLAEDNQLIRTLTNPLLDVGGFCNSAPWRQVSVAGANGHGNARSIARIQSVISHGGEVDGVRLLSPAMIDRLLQPEASGLDLVIPAELTWGLGYALIPPVAAPDLPAAERRCWWTGYGGAIVINDLDRRTTIAYAMNKLGAHLISSPRTDDYVLTAYRCLEETS